MNLTALAKVTLIWITLSKTFVFSQLNLDNRVPEWSSLGLRNESVFSTFNDVIFSDIQTQFNLSNCETIDYILLNFTNIQIILPPGYLHFNCVLNLPSNVVLSGDSIHSTQLIFDDLVESNLIQIIGGSGSEYDVQSYLPKNQNFLVSALIASNSSVNEMLYIYSPDDSLITSPWAGGSTGQFVTVVSISNDTLYFDNKLRRNYLSNCKVKKNSPKENIGLKNLSIINNCPSTSQTNNVLFDFSRNCFVSCVSSVNCNFSHINISNSSGVFIEKSTFKDGFTYGSGGKAYGIVLQFGTGDCLITNNFFDHLRHSILFQAGSNGNVVSYNYSINPFWTDVSLPSNSAGDIVLHGNYPYMNLIEGNSCQHIVIDDSHGKNGPYNTFLRNRANLYGIFMNTNPSTDSTNFIGNEITNTSLFMGNFITSGNGNLSSGNNKIGQCIPTNTEIGNQFSLYLDQPISFYSTLSNWPPIGYPNGLNQYKNKSEYAVLNLESLCDCCEDESLSLDKSYVQDFQLYYSNDLKKITIHSNEPIQGYIIYDLSGKTIEQQELINLKDVELINSYASKGYYIIQITSELSIKNYKIMIN